MKKSINILALFLFFFSMVSCNEDLVNKVQTGTLKGVVIKKGTNQPIKNVKIYTTPSTETIFTKEDGSFIIENVPLGDYSIRAELSGYVTSFQGVNFKNEGQVVSVVFEMSDDDSLNSPPSAPVLLSPVDNAVDQPLSVDLSWSCTDPDTLDILKYKVIIKNDFDSNIIEVKDLTDTHYFLENLKFGVTYYWQVIVSDGINPEVNSPVSRFRTSTIPNNRFHYVKKANGNYYIVSSDESNKNFQFTPSNTNSWRPRLNQNTGLIAFLRTVGGNAQIFTAKPDGSNPFQVTSVPVAGFDNAWIDFSWSKNGKELLYANFTKLYRINKDGSGLQLVYTTPDGSFISECEWSYDGSKVALKTNDANGYNVKIYIIDLLGNTIKTILENVQGAAGGLSLSIDGTQLLYCYDISGHQEGNYRQLNTHLFIYNLQTNENIDLSVLSKKPDGSNDLDPRFSPNNAEVIFMNTSNDGISAKKIIKLTLQNNERTDLFPDAEMPDWE
ncbi:carboxypeptidase-like regulatory domain-containing protein [Kaistella sp.]|uniref:carboxypeptidase-like regulatory domain-containing protein n=1 Tax=Kaistella sp. TaxID=2782235 RepID=UPI003C5C5977